MCALLYNFISVAVLFTGCNSAAMQNDQLYNKTLEIKTIVEKSDWTNAEQVVKDMNKQYKANEWKYQLMGTTKEYTEVDQELSKLKVSIEEQDKETARQSIEIIKQYMKSIYFQ